MSLLCQFVSTVVARMHIPQQFECQWQTNALCIVQCTSYKTYFLIRPRNKPKKHIFSTSFPYCLGLTESPFWVLRKLCFEFMLNSAAVTTSFHHVTDRMLSSVSMHQQILACWLPHVRKGESYFVCVYYECSRLPNCLGIGFICLYCTYSN